MIGSTWMQALWSGFARLCQDNAGRWVVKIMAWVGIAFVSYEAIHTPLMDWFTTHIAMLPVKLKAWLGAYGFDVALTMLFSAYVTRALAKIGIRKRT